MNNSRPKILEINQPGCWVNISPPYSLEELETLSEQLNIPLDFLTDSLDIDERSRYEYEEGTLLIVINSPFVNEVDPENEAVYITVPIGIILTEENLVTITAYKNDIIEDFLSGRVKKLNTDDHSYFVLKLLEQNVLAFTHSLKKLNLRRNLIEKELNDSGQSKELVALLSIEKSLVFFVNSLSSNELLKMKLKRVDLLRIRNNEELSDLLEDVIIDNSQALEMANVYTNILRSTMQAYSSIISNNINAIMQRLTLITIMLSVPTLIASVFGMNVPNGLESNGMAIFIIVGSSVILSLLLAIFFMRKRLL